MLRFAVCDDNEKELKQALALLEDYLLSRPGLAGRAEAFSSCAALLERGLSAARSEAPKLVLLNQADTPALQVQGEALVRRLEERGVEAYVTQLKESHIKC